MYKRLSHVEKILEAVERNDKQYLAQAALSYVNMLTVRKILQLVLVSIGDPCCCDQNLLQSLYIS